MIVFAIPGQPVAKGRPRFARRGNFIATYTPEKTANYETLVKWCAEQAMNGQEMIEGPLSMDVIIEIAIPASLSKKKRNMALEGDLKPTKRPDMDNILKAVIDGMIGVVYKDDAAIVELKCLKLYAEKPQVQVYVAEYRAP